MASEEMKTEVKDDIRTSNVTDSCEGGDSRVENDGVRMLHLRDALRKTIKKCIDSAKFSTFSRHYGKHMADRNPQALKSLLQQFKEQLETSIKTELELMIEEENLVPLFNELDKLIDSSPVNGEQPAWRPSGDPENDSRCHVMAAKQKEKERLERALQQVEEEGEQLQEVITGHRKNLMRTQTQIQEQLDIFSKAAAACDQVPVKDLEVALNQLRSSTVTSS